MIDDLSAEEVGKLVLGERNDLIQTKMQELLDDLLESEISEYFTDAVNAKRKRLTGKRILLNSEEAIITITSSCEEYKKYRKDNPQTLR